MTVKQEVRRKEGLTMGKCSFRIFQSTRWNINKGEWVQSVHHLLVETGYNPVRLGAFLVMLIKI